jgi:hypothetical protein
MMIVCLGGRLVVVGVLGCVSEYVGRDGGWRDFFIVWWVGSGEGRRLDDFRGWVVSEEFE